MSVPHAWSGLLERELALQAVRCNSRGLAAVATFARRAHRTKATLTHQSLDALATELLAGFGEVTMHVARP